MRLFGSVRNTILVAALVALATIMMAMWTWSHSSSVTALNVRTQSVEARNTLVDEMLLQFDAARYNLVTMLENDYGDELSKRIFNISGNRTQKLVLASAGEHNMSMARLKRKLTMKCLQVLIKRMDHQSASVNADATTESAHDMHMVPFVWATSGHSIAAGHGNLYNESYTAYLQRAVSDVFATAGLQFVGRNYAMGRMPCSPNLALCIDAVYGTDIDVLMWYFAVRRDVSGYDDKLAVFLRRAMLSPNHPAVVAYIQGSSFENQRSMLRSVEETGIAALYLDGVWNTSNAIPEMVGLTMEEINEIAPYARNFKCNGALETGEPFCSEEKFSTYACPHRNYQQSFHPGWKYFALLGNMVGLSLIELLHETLLEIRDYSEADIATLLARLRADEDREYASSSSVELSNAVKMLETKRDKSTYLNILFQQRGVCRTSLLPAETRYLGILDNSRKRATFSDTTGYTSFEQGTLMKDALETPNKGKEMRLVYSPNPNNEACDVLLHQDRKDSWLVQGTEDWQSITLPNQAELEAYGGQQTLLGILLICVAPFRNEQKEDLYGKSVTSSSRVMIRINGIPATKFIFLDNCFFPSRDEEVIWQPNTDGKYEIEVNIVRPKDYMRFSSFIIF